jgi:hypothetical protein
LQKNGIHRADACTEHLGFIRIPPGSVSVDGCCRYWARAVSGELSISGKFPERHQPDFAAGDDFRRPQMVWYRLSSLLKPFALLGSVILFLNDPANGLG